MRKNRQSECTKQWAVVILMSVMVAGCSSCSSSNEETPEPSDISSSDHSPSTEQIVSTPESLVTQAVTQETCSSTAWQTVTLKEGGVFSLAIPPLVAATPSHEGMLNSGSDQLNPIPGLEGLGQSPIHGSNGAEKVLDGAELVHSMPVSEDPRVLTHASKAKLHPDWQNAFSWNARLTTGGSDSVASCTAGLVDKNWAITAAHCVHLRDTGKYIPWGSRVFVGGVSTSDDEGTIENELGEPRKILSIHFPICYRPPPLISGNKSYKKYLKYDVALLRLDEPSLKTPQSPNSFTNLFDDSDYGGSTVKVAGWGEDADSTTITGRHLFEDSTVLVTNEECQPYYNDIKVSEEFACAGHKEGSEWHTACNGDSGMPLIYEKGGVSSVIGIAVFAPKNCAGPAAFLKLDDHISKITELIGST